MNSEIQTELKKPTSSSSGRNKNEATKLSAARYLSGVHRRALDTRRRYEWQILVASLTSGSALTLGILSGKIVVPVVQEFRVIAAFYLLALAMVASLYLFSIQGANATNKNLAHAAENAIGRLTRYKPMIDIIIELEKNSSPTAEKNPDTVKRFWSNHWSLTCELLAVWLAAVASALAIWFA
jgi:hypothetical protein